MAQSVNGSSNGGSASSRSSASIRARAEREQQEGQGEDLLDRRSPLENGIFGVLFTLSKENSETRIRIRWVILKILLDAWQLFTTVINPAKQGWDIDPNGVAWKIVGVLNFTWLGDLGYGAYLAVLYAMVALLTFNIGFCVWVAWCFKEHKFPVVWPIKVLRVFSSVFFQAFDVTSLNLLQLGISCRYTGYDADRLHFHIIPKYSCIESPHIFHAVVSALSLILFVAIALLLNMAEVEVNPLSRRPMALGHSGAEVVAFAIKVLLTLVDVFIGWSKVAACIYFALAAALAYQYLRWSPHLVAWVNYLKSGVAITILWCCSVLLVLVFLSRDTRADLKDILTIVMLGGLAPAFITGAICSRTAIHRMTSTALKSLAEAKPEVKIEDICDNLDDPRDIEIVARCCRVWKDRYTLDSNALNMAHQVIKAGLAMFPNSAYMVLLHGNFMIDVLGVSQSGGSRIEDARRLNPALMCRFIMFVRQQQATQKAVGSANEGASMDLLGYVEYQRKQRMVVRLHREALQAMCNFWKMLDATRVSFTHLSKALSKIESSVSQAQAAYRVVLESYGSNPKLVRLYGKFLQTIKNDPWRASEYFNEADRLEELKNGDARGPLLPDGTPLGRMDEMSTAVLVINAMGEVQVANKHTHVLFGYKRGSLEGKPLAILLAPHVGRQISERLTQLVSTSSLTAATGIENPKVSHDEVVVGMHYDRLAFPVKLSLRKVSGVGEDSTFVAMIEPMPSVPSVSSLWVAPNGTVAACDPQFVSNFGWKASEVNGSNIMAFLAVRGPLRAGLGDEEVGAAQILYGENPADMIARLLEAKAPPHCDDVQQLEPGLKCIVTHKYDTTPLECKVTVLDNGGGETPVFELRIKLDSEPLQLLVANRKGSILHVSSGLVSILKDTVQHGQHGFKLNGANSLNGVSGVRAVGGGSIGQIGPAGLGAADADDLAGYSLSDFLPSPWKEMHPKFLKDTTALMPPGRSQWTCRRNGLQGPTLELRTAMGKSVFMQVAVTTQDSFGELNHVVRLARSSLKAALSERRLRLSVDTDGLVTGLSEGSSRQIFGLDPSQVIGRGLWEIVEEEAAPDSGRLATPGPRMISTLVSRALSSPGQSWRVLVAPPHKARQGGILDIAAAARSTLSKRAVMQVFIEFSTDDVADDKAPEVFVELWPVTSITGVLELDATGRVRSVLEDQLRPAGLLFGVSTQALVGSMLPKFVTLPPGRARFGDLLSLHGAKKSSLKSSKKDASVKVGPMHVLSGLHADGRPAHLDVQVVGKPGPGQPVHVIVRYHVAPMMPAGTAGAPVGIRTSLYNTGPPMAQLQTPHSKEVTSVGETGAAAAGFLGLSKLQQGSGEFATSGTASKRLGPEAAMGDDATVRRLISVDPADVMSTPAAYGRSGSMRPTGYSSTLDVNGAGIAPTTPSPPTTLAAGIADGLPVPGVTSGKAAALTGRSKLGSLVRAVGISGAVGGTGTGHSSDSDGGEKPAFGKTLDSARMMSRKERKLPQGAAERPGLERPFPGTPPARSLGTGAGSPEEGPAGELGPLLALTKKGAPPADVQSVESDDNASDPEMQDRMLGNGRISTWVASKGAYYQNTIGANVQSDDDKSRRSGDFSDGGGTAEVVARVEPQPFNARPDADRKNSFTPAPRPEFSNYPEDDAASEGGQSAMSAQSGNGGAEYKRGKRFRKLIKLMDSSQAQQVQERFRTHALATVAFLAIVHVICFALIVTAIQSQRNSMLTLGHNGEAQRYMQQILADVRSLDVITKNKTIPWIYTEKDEKTFVDRIFVNAEKVKQRLNAMLDGHHSSSSPVRELFFYNSQQVWDGNFPNGTDIYTSLTIWDFATRFFSMSTKIVQHYYEWKESGEFVSNTDAGQFLLKSGPNLFKDFRKILDALLHEAADNVHWVDTLQLIFLAVEGTAISFVAACYLAYLLRAVAAQRHKLYATFLVIPLGLTRALASQNTALLVDDDDDDDMDDEDERPAAQTTVDEEGEEGDGGGKVIKRRATLNVASDMAMSVVSGGGDGAASDREGLPSFTRGGRSRSASTGGDRKGGDGFEGIKSPDKSRQRTLTSDTLDSVTERNSCWPLRRLWRFITRADRRVTPLQQASPNASASKRKLKDDSHETVIMMVPFVFWSAVVITIYAIAVVHMKGVVEVVAIHSVSNFMAARTYRAIFYSQELAIVEDPLQLKSRRTALLAVIKLVRDAWYTLQLGDDAYLAAGPDTERFPLVKDGLAYASSEISSRFYGTGICHRQQEHLPCVEPSNRFYQVTRTGLDSMMQQFMISITSMATNVSMVPEGLEDEHFDFVYNVGRVDLADGTVGVEIAHYDTIIELFHNILVLHVILFLVLWIVFAGFLILLLNPLLKRVSKERRRIAELMSQLPLELDVERLVARALGTAPNPTAGAPQAGSAAARGGMGDAGLDGGDETKSADATSKWKAIIRSATATAQKVNPPQRGPGSSFSASKMA